MAAMGTACRSRDKIAIARGAPAASKKLSHPKVFAAFL
jgi:hypothetical protein